MEEGLDLSKVLPADRPTVIEIGCGMGDATLAMAKANPEVTILAIDVHTPGLGVLLRDCERDGVDNVRVAECDAVALLTQAVPPDWLAGLRIYFPDPWPKVRQQKRRLIQPEFTHLAAGRLAPGAVMHLATDWVPYAEHMLAVLSAEPLLKNQFPDFAPRPEWRPVTKFERRGINLGHEIRDLLFERVPNS